MVSQTTSSTTTIMTIPDYYYTIDTLLTYINENLPTTDSAGNVLTFGVKTSTTTTEPAMYYRNLYDNLHIAGYADSLTQAVSYATNTHVYQSFELVIDSETIPLLQGLGFIINDRLTTSYPPIVMHCTGFESSGTTQYVINATQQWTTGYSFNSIGTQLSANTNYIASFCFDMQYVTTLYASLENAISQNRATYTNLQKTDYLFAIPVNAPYGYPISYQCTVPQRSYMTNMSLSTIHITLCDQYSRNVDFRGADWDMTISIQFGYNDETFGNNAMDLNVHNVPHGGIDGTGITSSGIDPLTGRGGMLNGQPNPRPTFPGLKRGRY